MSNWLMVVEQICVIFRMSLHRRFRLFENPETIRKLVMWEKPDINVCFCNYYNNHDESKILTCCNPGTYQNLWYICCGHSNKLCYSWNHASFSVDSSLFDYHMGSAIMSYLAINY